ncbi:MAG: archease [Thermoplasmatales archaeon]|nr:archease [Thermoplasmatales archaeon]
MAPRPRARRRWGRFPTTADIGIWARGSSPSELFEALGLGLFALITDLRTVRARAERAVSASGDDPVSLAVAYLGELLLLQQTEGFLARDIEVRTLGTPPTALVARVQGEPFDPGRHPARMEVKAITLHAARVDLGNGRARLIVDI